MNVSDLLKKTVLSELEYNAVLAEMPGTEEDYFRMAQYHYYATTSTPMSEGGDFSSRITGYDYLNMNVYSEHDHDKRGDDDCNV